MPPLRLLLIQQPDNTIQAVRPRELSFASRREPNSTSANFNIDSKLNSLKAALDRLN